MIPSAVLPSILIIDEDEEMMSILANQCQSAEYALIVAKNFSEALQHLQNSAIALLLTSSRIPEISLAEFLKRVRNFRPASSLSVLVLLYSESERESVMKAEADDVLLKPFERSGLTTKIKTLIKKIRPEFGKIQEHRTQLTFKDLVLDTKSFDVFCKGERIKLTPNEFKLLQSLLEHPGVVLSRDRLIELVQGEGVAVIDRAVDTHVFSLRKKLGELGDSIETVRGEGYRIG
jgi:two-component system phosphate regulon response regulator PhoB